jgi:hypothetical protein
LAFAVPKKVAAKPITPLTVTVSTATKNAAVIKVKKHKKAHKPGALVTANVTTKVKK